MRTKTFNINLNIYLYFCHLNGTKVFQFNSFTEKLFKMVSYTLVVVKFIILWLMIQSLVRELKSFKFKG